MSLSIVAAKDLNHAFEILTFSPRKTMKHHIVPKFTEDILNTPL